MALIVSYNRAEQFYQTYLTTIKGVKFTFREMDVLACIVHNRGEKKIASLLGVSPRTVSAHVYNIMGKIGCNSKDQVIDFIEGSDKLIIIREYYLLLLIKSNFEKQLIKIGTYINKEAIKCFCYRDETLNINTSLYQSIQKHLKLANTILLEILPGELEQSKKDEKTNNYILNLNNITEENYYKDILNSILELLKYCGSKTSEIEEVIIEFNDNYQMMQDTYEGKITNQEISENKIEIPPVPKKVNLISISFVSLIFISIGLYFNSDIFQSSKSLVIENKNSLREDANLKSSQIIKDLEEFLESIKNEQFTSDNITQGQAKKNHSLIKKVEKLLDYQNLHEIQGYLANTEMSAEIITNYLYNLQALASYYLYNMHNSEKAKQILLHGKKLVESYINNRGNVISDFNQLSNAEILAELQIVDDLPQIYARIIYTLGRCYIYEASDMRLAQQYFELSKYLSSKLNLFEKYLSDSSGLLIISKELAYLNLKEGKVDIAKETLISLIKSYKSLGQDGTNYIVNYKPAAIKQQYIIPKEHSYSLFECGTKIISVYAKLLSISKDREEIRGYITEINKYLIGDEKFKGLMQLTKEISQRKIADLYNNLGNIMINIWRLKVVDNIILNDQFIKRIISQGLSLNIDDPLKLAEKLFETAKDLSRNSDFTKADSYDGLAKVYQLKMEYEASNFSEEEKQILQEQIKVAMNKSDLINQQLNRKRK